VLDIPSCRDEGDSAVNSHGLQPRDGVARRSPIQLLPIPTGEFFEPCWIVSVPPS
jgi:hypothetical protein